jgi:acyl transferase domain-containing protein
MTDDYQRMYSIDPDTFPPQGVIGTSPSILPNRISWYFDLVGPSVHVDTACSGSMVAVDLAVQSLRNGNATMVVPNCPEATCVSGTDSRSRLLSAHPTCSLVL